MQTDIGIFLMTIGLLTLWYFASYGFISLVAVPFIDSMARLFGLGPDVELG